MPPVKGKTEELLKAGLSANHIDRFHSLYEPVPMCGCWIWTGYTNDSGYGSFWVRPKNIRAHRVSWFLHKGEIPDGLLVLHKCDNPFCVNPDHLFLGTDRDNSVDRDAKGRTPLGSKRVNAKLTEDNVREIRASWPAKSAGKLAKEYNMHQTVISGIIRGVRWKHV